MADVDNIELKLKLDQRLHDLHVGACAVGEWSYELVCAYLRAAYALGHGDALREVQPENLYRDLNYRVPRRGDRLGWHGK